MSNVPLPETTRLLRDLVTLPSVNPMGRPPQGDHFFEHRVTSYLEVFFRGLGVAYERQPVAPLRDNIVARTDLPGTRRTLLLEAHQDTVPTDGVAVPCVPNVVSIDPSVLSRVTRILAL